MSSDTQTIHGVKACMAVFDHRPHDILRIFYRSHVAKQLAVMLRWAASRGIVYRELDEEGMGKVAKSTHHEGLVLVTQPLRFGSFYEDADDTVDDAADEAAIDATGKASGDASAGNAAGIGGGPLAGPSRWMALDGVENPHNMGAILRTCAFYGLNGLLAGGVAAESKVNSAALRVAEGGAEFLRLCGASELAPALAELAGKGWSVIGLETDAAPLPAGYVPGPRWILAVGHEQEGLSPAVREACPAVYSIAGEGRLGSLNVSVATGIALSRLCDPPGKSAPPSNQQSSRPPGGGEPGSATDRPKSKHFQSGAASPPSTQGRGRMPRNKPGKGGGKAGPWKGRGSKGGSQRSRKH